MTRGTSKDYTFIGETPEEWWSEYKKWTFAEYPSLIFIFNTSEKLWRLYMSGIPSERKDRVSTTIRYTLILESERIDKEELNKILTISGYWIKDISKLKLAPRSSSKLGSLFDQVFTKEYVDDQLHCLAPDKKDAETLEQKISNIINSAVSSDDSLKDSFDNDKCVSGKWVSSLNKEGQDKWLSYIKTLIQEGNKSGIAAYLNAASKEEANQVMDGFSTGAILINTDDKPQKVKPSQTSTLIRCKNAILDKLKSKIYLCAVIVMSIALILYIAINSGEKQKEITTKQTSPDIIQTPENQDTANSESKKIHVETAEDKLGEKSSMGKTTEKQKPDADLSSEKKPDSTEQVLTESEEYPFGR
jgi:hypothetical protein